MSNQPPLDVIRFTAQVYKVQTLVDGGLRVTLDLPESAIAQAGDLMQVRRAGALLEVAAVAIVEKQKENNAVQSRSVWQP